MLFTAFFFYWLARVSFLTKLWHKIIMPRSYNDCICCWWGKPFNNFAPCWSVWTCCNCCRLCRLPIDWQIFCLVELHCWLAGFSINTAHGRWSNRLKLNKLSNLAMLLLPCWATWACCRNVLFNLTAEDSALCECDWVV